MENMPSSRKRKVDDMPMKNDKAKRKALANITNIVEEDQQEQQQVEAPRDAKCNDDVTVAVVGAAPAAPAAPSVLDKVDKALTRPETLKPPVAAEQPMAVPLSVPDAEPQPLFEVTVQQPLIVWPDNLPPVPPVPADVEDFDRKNWDDPLQVSHYAQDIFNYLKQREPEFRIHDYMAKQPHLTVWRRALLVDAMVDIHELFNLKHETLYLAVKIVDLYLCRKEIKEEQLVLLGDAALIIACKYDDRYNDLFEDFMIISEGAYAPKDLIKMEMETLRTIKFDLGIPLSFRFLSRYARCAKVQLTIVKLARYILELSLTDYVTIGFRDSKMAAAALFMALRMHGGIANVDQKTWSPTLIYYTSYKLADFARIIPFMNAGLHRKQLAVTMTIRNKYSRKKFRNVTSVPLLSIQEMFQSNLDLNGGNQPTG